jgi:hypothetical protein
MKYSDYFETILLNLIDKDIHNITYIERNTIPDEYALMNHLKRFCMEKFIPITIQSIQIESVDELHATWCCYSVTKKVWKITLVVKV